MTDEHFAAVVTQTSAVLDPRHGHRFAPLGRRMLWAAVAVAAVFALTACTSEKDRLDAEARRLCAIDGGIKVFETVTLPPEKFNQYGQPLIPNGKDDKGYGYFRRSEQTHLTGPVDSARGPNLTRDQTQIVRSSDGKVMGEITYYGRAGGCLLDGYIQGCGFRCPKTEGWSFENKIFIKGENK